MKRVENFHKSLQFDRLDVTRIVQAKQDGIIKSYFLTTLSAMNARRVTDFCLWCDAIWSIHHRCEHAPDYNCRFSFGEDGDGMAFVKVTKEGLKPMLINESQVEPVSNASKVFDELSQPNLGSVNAPIVEASIAHKVFDKMPDSIKLSGSHLSTAAPQIVYNEATRISIASNYGQNSSVALDAQHVSESQALSAQKAFDELPLPDFIKELSETSRAIELNPIGDMSDGLYKPGFDGLDEGAPLLFNVKSNIKSSRQINDFLSTDIMHGEGNLLASTDIFSELAYSQVRIELVLVPNKISMVSFKKFIVLNLIQLDLAHTSPTWKHVFGKVLDEISYNIMLSEKFVLKSHDELPKLNKFNVGQDWRDSVEITIWLPSIQYNGIIRHDLAAIPKPDNSDHTKLDTLYFRCLGPDSFEVALLHVFLYVRYDKVGFPIKSNQWSTWAQRIYCNRLGARGSFKYFDPGIYVLLFRTLTLEDKGDLRREEMVRALIFGVCSSNKIDFRYPWIESDSKGKKTMQFS